MSLLNQFKKTPIKYVKGIGENRGLLFEKLDITNLYQLLTYYPYRFENRKNLITIKQLQFNNEWQTIFGTVIGYDEFRLRGTKKVLKILIADDTGYLSLVCYNRNFLKKILQKEMKVYLSSSRFIYKYNEIQTSDFDYEIVSNEEPEDKETENIHTNRIVPIYHTTENLSIKLIRTVIFNQLKKVINDIEDPLPVDIKEKYKLKELSLSLYKMHFPADLKEIEIVRQRLAFDRFFYLELILALNKKQAVLKKKQQKYELNTFSENFLQQLPFQLTNDQQRCINEIQGDMHSEKIMNRLLMGDVGSGKTIVALVAALLVIENGFQTAFMVPTEILAQQHYLNLKRILAPMNIEVGLLIGKLKASEKKKVLEQIKNGELNIIIGTHALIEENVVFHKLGFIIIDEQHRFGVLQRANLHLKANTPDILVMTATPIPRTLSLTVYGDLDISVIKEMPKGRLPIKTFWYHQNKLDEVFAFLREQMKKGQQIYVVYPLVSESDKVDLKDAETMYQQFKNFVFKEFNIGLIHGQMKKEEKDQVMAQFRENKINLLVATTVIEVGIDVANASVMVIEHAERFGIAQLHQLRGRIGRGEHQSYCLLITSYKTSDEARQRMQALVKYQDGFKLAEIDLELRGPGELMGTKQTGLPDLKPADLIKDQKILEIARKEAFEIVTCDSALSNYPQLKEYLINEEYNELSLIKVS